MLTSNRDILFIGPLPPPINGQAICFDLVQRAFGASKVVNRNVEQFNLLNKFYVFYRALLNCLFFFVFL